MILRPSAERDIPEVLIAYQDDPLLHLRLGEERPPSGAELGRRAEQAWFRWRAGELATLTIVEAGSDVCCGEIRVHSVDWENRRAEVGVWIGPRQRRRGLARRALGLATQWLLRDAGLERVGLLTERDNQAMVAAARAAGFSEEGVLRGHTVERGSKVDNLVLSRVRSDLKG